jgi:spermidine/putrescine transport system permease protein
MKKSSLLSNIFLGVVLLLTYIPIVSLVFFSFNSSKSLTQFSSFSFVWYQKLFTSSAILEAVRTTFIIAIVSTVVATIIGTLAAISLNKFGKRTRKLSLTVNNIPMVNPEIITAISLFVLFGAFNLDNGYLKVILAHIAFSIPYVLVAVYPKVRSLDSNLEDAAYDLGATPLKSLLLVILPQLRTSIISGAAMAFAMSFDDFVISLFASGSSGVQNISIYLYTQMQRKDPTFNALSTIIIAFIGVKVLFDLFTQAAKERKNKHKKHLENLLLEEENA